MQVKFTNALCVTILMFLLGIYIGTHLSNKNLWQSGYNTCKKAYDKACIGEWFNGYNTARKE